MVYNGGFKELLTLYNVTYVYDISHLKEQSEISFSLSIKNSLIGTYFHRFSNMFFGLKINYWKIA